MTLLRILSLGCVVALACGSSGTIIGTIYVIGNEPFTQVAIQDSTGAIFRIETTKEIEQRLREMQGRKVTLEYSNVTTTEDGKIITVVHLN
jgi:hypothetical protein